MLLSFDKSKKQKRKPKFEVDLPSRENYKRERKDERGKRKGLNTIQSGSTSLVGRSNEVLSARTYRNIRAALEVEELVG